MATCGRCGSEARDEARFCPRCGRTLQVRSDERPTAQTPPPAPFVPSNTLISTPPPSTHALPPSRHGVGTERPAFDTAGSWVAPKVVLTAVVVAVLIAVSSAATWYVAGAGDRGAAPPPSAVPQPPPAIAEGSSVTTLAGQVDADAGTAQGLVGRWSPQLSSKAVGMTVDGMTYDEASILAHFRSLRERYPSAVLVRSSDYASFRNPGFWVVLAAVPSDDAGSANAWCDSQGIGVDDCYAKRLTTTGGPDGNTVRRGQ